MNPAARSALIQAAGAENFSDGQEDRLLYSYDATGKSYPPEAVVRGVEVEQIARVLAAASQHRVPVVPRGAGSGQSGGSLPVDGGLVLNLAGMDRILKVDPADHVAVVQPGVITADLQRAAEARGLFYPPDPASVEFCTVGGNAAENSGGLRAVKYGVTRDYVLALQAVLPDGRVLRTGRSTMKTVVGYDLTRLLVGSEGTLAVMTELTLRLLPKPEAKATVSALFHELETAAQAVQAVLMSGITPAALEFIDSQSLGAVNAHAGLGLPPEAEAMVLIDVDGAPEVVAGQARRLARVLEEGGGRQVRLALDPAEAAELWRARRSMGPAMYNLAPNKLNEDVVVPLGRLAQAIRAIHAIGQRRGVLIPTFGHAGDGNLHVNVMYDASDPEQNRQAHQAVTDVFAQVLKVGGSLSGEHGVGNAKLGYVGAELDPVAMELMRGIKRLFDPAGILNPHKAVPTPDILA
ncbi:FAD-binding oxidoreductase [Desulfoferula mesophila]|uniref:FAD-binding protein n=1 Tax=Desulfoferula mesophila TaxID=3058419 RepID=A0AAU9ELA8_9BACT|nr:FAD-binding protein [Desulfoferula mesophilus]